MINPDTWILLHINSLAHHSPAFDKVMSLFAGQTLLKGGVIFAIYWGAWFDQAEDQRARRVNLLCGILGAIIALAFARGIAALAPFRERPMNALAEIRIPYTTSSENLIHWSSFPSDHAALYVGVSIGILLANRRLGILALFYSLVFICLPRIYLGIHYPSDILVGGLIGTFAVLLTANASLGKRMVQPWIRFEALNPSLFYMISFFVTAQMVDMFTAARRFAVIVLQGLKG